MIGRVTAVREERAQTELSADADAGDTTLTLLAPSQLSQLGGSLRIGSEVKTYTFTDGVCTLGSALASAYDAETPVAQEPIAIERIASVQAQGQWEEVDVRVPHNLYALLPVGIREDNETAEVIETQNVDGELVVGDVRGRSPEFESDFLTFSDPVSTEGLALPSGTGGEEEFNTQVVWVAQDGAYIASIRGYEQNGARVTVVAASQDDARESALILQSKSETGVVSLVYPSDNPVGQTDTLINNESGVPQSRFMRRANSDGAGIHWGVASITGDGNPTRTVEIPHSLQITPSAVFATVNGDSANFYCNAKPIDEGTIELTLVSRSGSNFSGTHTVYWQAMQ